MEQGGLVLVLYMEQGGQGLASIPVSAVDLLVLSQNFESSVLIPTEQIWWSWASALWVM